MADFKSYSVCKLLAIVLSVLIAGQVQVAISYQEETPQSLFNAAKAAFVNGQFEAASAALTKLAERTVENEESKAFLADVHLLLGASEESRGNAEAARQHYAKARALLGDKPAVIEGVSFSSLPIYLEIFATQSQKDEAAALQAQFASARTLYFSGNFEGAKLALEKLMSTFAALEGWDALKGETYLLLGASYEKLKYKELAVKSYCRAKEILGEGKTIEGLELKKLKYYKVECRAVAARAGGRRGSFLGKALGTLLFLGALGGLVWYLFFSPNAPLKPKGEYTSVTVRVDVTFKGKNSIGTRTLSFDGVERLNEAFDYPQDALPCNPPSVNPTCDGATKSESYSWEVVTDGKSLDVILRYLNWDYRSHAAPACKILCSDWTFTITDYKWESGKRDPGSPSVEGTDELSMNGETDCVPPFSAGGWIHNCTTETQLTFKAPGAGVQTQKVFTASNTIKHSN